MFEEGDGLMSVYLKTSAIVAGGCALGYILKRVFNTRTAEEDHDDLIKGVLITASWPVMLPMSAFFAMDNWINGAHWRISVTRTTTTRV